MDVFWLEQSEADVPAENEWLSQPEMLHLDSLRFARRRADWRLGRWTAKLAIAAFLDLPVERQLAEIEIRASSSGAPEAFLLRQPARVSISLSHRSGIALCAVAPEGTSLGCDLELIEPRSEAFISDYFTAQEQCLVEQTSPADRELLVSLLWSAKESVLKALREGLRLDTRSVEVNVAGGFEQYADGWHPLRVTHDKTRPFYGWWRRSDGMVRTIVSTVPRNAPRMLVCERTLAADSR